MLKKFESRSPSGNLWKFYDIIYCHEPVSDCKRPWERLRRNLEESKHLSYKCTGFVGFNLLKGPSKEDHILYASHTQWKSESDFEAWTKSEAFRKAHSGAGGRGHLYLGHPEFEGFEVILTFESGSPDIFKTKPLTGFIWALIRWNMKILYFNKWIFKSNRKTINLTLCLIYWNL